MTDVSFTRKWGTLAILSLALAIIIIDTTILNVSLATIIRDFNTSITNIQWVITVYSLTLAALTITGGRLGDFFGRKRMFVVGATIFAVGSFITSISQNVPTMIAGESIIEGIGAAMMMPATMSLLVANFRGQARAVAFGVWGGVAGAAAALGPILGGYLTTNYSWRWGFRVNVFVVLLLLLGSFIIKESHDEEERPTIDWLGVLLSSVGLLSFVFGVIESSTYGWWKAKTAFDLGGHLYNFWGGLSVTPFALVIGLVGLIVFALWEIHVEKGEKTPLVSLKLFSNRQFTSGALTTAILSLGQAGIFFSIPIFLQSVRGLSALDTGLAFLPMSLTLLITSPLMATVGSRITSPKRLVQAGLVVNFIALWVIRNGVNVNGGAWSLAPGLILFGLGFGTVMSQINNLTISAVSVQEAGEAAGVNNTLRQVGATFGSAIIGAILIGTLTTGLVTGINANSVIPQSMKPAIANAVSSQASNVEFGEAAKSSALPARLDAEITVIAHQASVDADRKAMAFASIFSILGLLVSLMLPNRKDLETNASLAHKNKAVTS